MLGAQKVQRNIGLVTHNPTIMTGGQEEHRRTCRLDKRARSRRQWPPRSSRTGRGICVRRCSATTPRLVLRHSTSAIQASARVRGDRANHARASCCFAEFPSQTSPLRLATATRAISRTGSNGCWGRRRAGCAESQEFSTYARLSHLRTSASTSASLASGICNRIVS